MFLTLGLALGGWLPNKAKFIWCIVALVAWPFYCLWREFRVLNRTINLIPTQNAIRIASRIGMVVLGIIFCALMLLVPTI